MDAMGRLVYKICGCLIICGAILILEIARQTAISGGSGSIRIEGLALGVLGLFAMLQGLGLYSKALKQEILEEVKKQTLR